MVNLLPVPLLVPNGSFGCTFSVHLPDPSIHPISNYAKALEGQAALKYTGSMILWLLLETPERASVKFIQMIAIAYFLSVPCCFQVVPSVINGGITALYFILWGKGLKSCGPLR